MLVHLYTIVISSRVRMYQSSLTVVQLLGCVHSVERNYKYMYMHLYMLLYVHLAKPILQIDTVLSLTNLHTVMVHLTGRCGEVNRKMLTHVAC